MDEAQTAFRIALYAPSTQRVLTVYAALGKRGERNIKLGNEYPDCWRGSSSWSLWTLRFESSCALWSIHCTFIASLDG
jgi:hypothetical protein